MSPELRVIDPSILGPGVDADQLAAMGVNPDDMPEDSAFEDSAFFVLTEEEPPELGSPPFNKVYADGAAALADLPDGATVFIDGFGGPGGMAHYLLVALRDRGSRGLTIVSNTAGIARVVSFGTPPGKTAIDHSLLIENGQVAKAIASFPVSPSVSRPSEFELAYRRGEVDLELVPQGTLAERLRAGGAGIPAFYTPTGAGTLISEGKESRVIDGREYILEYGLQADYAIIRAHQADTRGNLVYRGTSRNFNAVMAPAARITVVEVDEIVESGELDPEEIVTPGVFVQRIVRRPEGFTGYE
jgi:3-oxoacid CoA-transferase A subunit